MERELTLDAGGLSLFLAISCPLLPQTPRSVSSCCHPAPERAPGGLPGELAALSSASLYCCDGICEAARRRRPGCALSSARLGWAGAAAPLLSAARSWWGSLALLRPPVTAAAAVDAAVLLWLLDGAAPGPPSARPALTSPAHLPPPTPPPQGVPSEPPTPIRPVTALSSSRRCWGRRRWRRQGTAGGSGVPRPSATLRRKPDGPTLIELASRLPRASEANSPTPGGRARRRRRGRPAKGTQSPYAKNSQLQGYWHLHLRPGRAPQKLVSGHRARPGRAMSPVDARMPLKFPAEPRREESH